MKGACMSPEGHSKYALFPSFSSLRVGVEQKVLASTLGWVNSRTRSFKVEESNLESDFPPLEAHGRRVPGDPNSPK